MHFEDNQAISFARYRRAARFPYVPPELTYLSYRLEFEEFLQGLPKDLKALRREIEVLLFDLIARMGCLPASSTHHHRTAGGLFYHSFETGALAAKYAFDDTDCPRFTLAALLGGLLHDLGKCVSLFTVSKLETSDIEPPLQVAPASLDRALVFDPSTEMLSDWCEGNDVEFMALQFHSRPRMGHVAHGAALWKGLVTEPLLQFVAQHDEAYGQLSNYLDGHFSRTQLRTWISIADNESILRDMTPIWRVEPKRSDLHLARRFLEFMYLSPWNVPGAPFVDADICAGSSENFVGSSFPFLVATPANIHRFVDYARAEDHYGHSLPSGSGRWKILSVLEGVGLIERRLPGASVDRKSLAGVYPDEMKGVLSFNGDQSSNKQEIPLWYCSSAHGQVAKVLPSASVLFE